MVTLRTDLEAQGFELIETHISWVFLGNTEVYKVKRPVDLGFLDFTTIDKRREACEAEVRLNARLAPQVYLGVVSVTRDAAGAYAFGGQGEIVDWAVRMRRLPDDERADRRLEQGKLEHEDIDRLAALIADFHAHCRTGSEVSRHGHVDIIGKNVRENFDQTRESIGQYLDPAQAREVEAWQLEALTMESRFADRIAANRVRDGHGDLRLEHVYFREDGTIAIIDCIEFNERFRYADVCADIAFLSMDLAWNGRIDLAERFLARYAWETDDYDLYSVVNFYESYRAFVRGKVSSLLAADAKASEGARERARREARRYFLLSVAFERQPLVPPRIVAVGGMIASGKSTWARRIGDLLAAPVLSSDRTRKRLAGKDPTESMRAEAWSGEYSLDVTENVYAELRRRAEVIVRSGRPVVVDASFRTAAFRRAIRETATALGVPFLHVECLATREVYLARLQKRQLASTHESDARAELLDEFVARYEAVDELGAEEHLVIDTSRPKAENQRQIEGAFATYPHAESPS